MTLTDLSPPPTGPVTLAAAKTFLRIDHVDEDDFIRDLIDVAARQIEARCGVSLITRPQRLTKPSVLTDTGHGIYLTRYPILSIESVTQNDEALPIEGNLKGRPVFLNVKAKGSVTVDFAAGFGDAPEDIPTPLRQGVLLLLAHLYEYRNGDGPPGFPMMVDALIQPYRGIRL